MQPVNSGTGMHPGVSDSNFSNYRERERETEGRGRRNEGKERRRWRGRGRGIETNADTFGSPTLKEGKVGPWNPSCSNSANNNIEHPFKSESRSTMNNCNYASCNMWDMCTLENRLLFF